MTSGSLSEIHPFDPRILVEPWEYNRRLRQEAPVYRDPHTGVFLVSSYDAVMEAAQRWDVFSNRFGRELGGAARAPEPVLEVARQGFPPVDTMLTADPPEQRRFRKLVNKAFVPRRVNDLEPHIEALADELVDHFAGKGRVELHGQYSQLLPLTLISEQLGVPRADLPLFRRWSDGFVAQLGQMADLDGQVAAAKMIVEFQHYFAARLDERWKEPRKDIISDIVHSQVEGERPLDVPESLSILQQLLVAGNETTANAISEGMLLLVREPEQLALVLEDPVVHGPNLVEELLRLSTPTQNMWRIATRNTRLAGVEIPGRSLVMLRYASANRDETHFPDPDRLDVLRENAGEHLAFGFGIHYCLGAMLARKEMLIAFRTLLGRLSGWHLDESAPPPSYRPNVLLRSLEALHLGFSPA
jgi:cytochrome P450